MKLNKNLYEAGAPFMLDFPSGNLQAPQNFTHFEVQIVNTPSGIDFIMFFEPAISSNIKLSLFATAPVKNCESYGTTKRFKIAVLDSSFLSGSSIKELYWKKYSQLPDTMSKIFFEYQIRKSAIRIRFSSQILRNLRHINY